MNTFWVLSWCLAISNGGYAAIVLRRNKAEGSSSEQTKLKVEGIFEPSSAVEVMASSLWYHLQCPTIFASTLWLAL